MYIYIDICSVKTDKRYSIGKRKYMYSGNSEKVERARSHKLAIETGCYASNRVVRNKRQNRDIEDEYGFIIVCPLYADNRKLFIKAYFYKRPNVMKFIELLNATIALFL